MTEEIKLEARLGEGARRTDAYLNNLATFQASDPHRLSGPTERSSPLRTSKAS